MAEQARGQARQPAETVDGAEMGLDADKVSSTTAQAPQPTTEPELAAHNTSPEHEAQNIQADRTSAISAEHAPEQAILPAPASSDIAPELTSNEFQDPVVEQVPEHLTQPEPATSNAPMDVSAHDPQPPIAKPVPQQATEPASTTSYTASNLPAEKSQPSVAEQTIGQASEPALSAEHASTEHGAGNLQAATIPETMAEHATEPATTATYRSMELTSENLQAIPGSMTMAEQLSVEAQGAPTADYTAPELTADEIVGANLHIDSAQTSDRDSAYGDDGYSTQASSLNSDVTDFRTYDNRRYHAFKENQYWLPNDDEEISRLELQHLVWRLCLNGRLHIAPIPLDVHRVLDLGTGTGKWAIEFADMHPSAEVIGTDLSPIQPVSVPSNCSFIVENVEDDWVYPEPFDYIHSRMLCLGIHDWKRYFQQCYDNLKPGGWCEAQETKFPIHSASSKETLENSPLMMWSEYMRHAAMNDGIESDPGPFFRGYLEEIGFTDIREQRLQWPIGPWPKGDREKLIGRIMIDNVKQFYRPSAMALYTKRLGWTVEQVEEFLPSVDKDLHDRSRHYYVQMHIVAARKPNGDAN